jgi:3-dehydroquinate dehydratase/shikimate dehydrogenase
MGECGLATRVLAKKFGSVWTYAGDQYQIGQIAASDLLDSYRFRALSERTDVYGVVGRPISHSVSPVMHNAAFAATRHDAVYLPFPAADADDFVTFGRAIGIKGASVTIPFKVSLFDRMDEVYAVARRIGAINTMKAEDGRWIGGNTDAAAFLSPLRDRVNLRGTRVAVLGAGGAARAVAVALSSCNAQVTVYARSAAKAQEVAMTTAAEAATMPPKPDSWDILVNCTPVGMYPKTNETPLDAADGPPCVRPGLQPDDDPPDARSGDRWLRGDRRARNARRAGAGAVRVVDRNKAAVWGDDGGRAEAACGVHAQ